MRRTLKQRH